MAIKLLATLFILAVFGSGVSQTLKCCINHFTPETNVGAHVDDLQDCPSQSDYCLTMHIFDSGIDLFRVERKCVAQCPPMASWSYRDVEICCNTNGCNCPGQRGKVVSTGSRPSPIISKRQTFAMIFLLILFTQAYEI